MIMSDDLIKDLALLMLGDGSGVASYMARRRLRKALGLHEYDDPQTVEATVRAALDGRPRPARREIIWREQVQPGLAVLVEDSTNILLELSTPQGQVLGRSEPVNRAALAQSVGNAHVAATVARDRAEDDRLRGLREAEETRRLAQPRDGENAASRDRAARQLADADLDVLSAQRVLRRAYGHLSATFNVDGTDQLGTVTYDREAGTYHVRVPERQDDTLARISQERRALDDGMPEWSGG
jgi:hypothetical protein